MYFYDNSSFARGARRAKEALRIFCKYLFFLPPFPAFVMAKVFTPPFWSPNQERSGVTFGSGSVVGAGVILTKSLPSDSVAIGNPAIISRKKSA
jgi:hypothetical protein